MSAHPCPCGHATMMHGVLGCNVPDDSTRSGACECAQTFRDLTAGQPNPLLSGGTIAAAILNQVGETTPATFVPNRPTATDSQVGGDHYLKHSIQPWDIWQEYELNAFEGAVLKYLLRRKGDRVEDLKKARHTLDRLIEIEEARGGVLREEAEEAG